MRHKILFQHIPKTAGTSLIEHAERLLGPRVCPARYDDQLSDDAMRDEDLVFYQGHFSLDVVRRFRSLHPDCVVFTFVRHPIARTLSQYHNWLDRDRVRRELDLLGGSRAKDAARIRMKFEKTIFGMSLDRFMRSGDADIWHVAGNLQAQYLTDAEKPDHLRLSRAGLNAVSLYDFIGLQEIYEPCLRIVEAKCGFPVFALGGANHANTNAHARIDGKYVVTPEQFEALQHRNIYDTALFHACHTLLVTRYADYLPKEALDVGSLIDFPAVVPGAPPAIRRRAATAYPSSGSGGS